MKRILISNRFPSQFPHKRKMSRDNNKTECPVCGQSFSSTEITKHVNKCLNDDDFQDEEVPPKKRRTSDWSFMRISQHNESNTTKLKKANSAKTKSGSKKNNNSNSVKGRLKEDKIPHCMDGYHANKSLVDAEDGSSDVECIDGDQSSKQVIDSPSLRLNQRQIAETKAREEGDICGLPAEHKSNKDHSQAQANTEENHSMSNNKMYSMKVKSVPSSLSTFNRKTDSVGAANVPLAERVRPKSFEHYIGQKRAVGRKSLLHSLLVRNENIPSMILWGPPGCGKTTLAKIIAQNCRQQGNTKFITMSATSANVNDVKEASKIARNDLKMLRRKTIIFLDEIHRFNKLQQDVLLPHVEDGTITLIGATTENPSFYVNSALLSRCRVITLEKLEAEEIQTILEHALQVMGISLAGEEEEEEEEIVTEENCQNVTAVSTNRQVRIDKSAVIALSNLVDGDARAALNGLQLAVEGRLAETADEEETEVKITLEHVKEGLQRSHILYDKTGEEHYNTASALIKSMRGSDASAALYWAIRMLEGGENPLFIARRLVVFASEDVGLADPQALTQAVATYQACHFIGMPECQYNLAQCVVYLARANKSIEVTSALRAAQDCVRNHQGPLPGVPLHLRNASTSLMKSLGYGQGYKYTPIFEGADKEQDYFPASLSGTDFFKTGFPQNS